MTAVVGMGLVSALGPDKYRSWQRLLDGDTPIRVRQPFAHIPPAPLAMVADAPADPRRLLLMALTEALQDAGWTLPLPDCGVVIASSRCEQAVWEQWLAGQRQDLDRWLDHLPGRWAGWVAAKVGAKSWVAAPMAACASGIWAVATAMEWLRRGDCSRVIVGAVDAAITPLTLAGFRQMGVLATEGCFPFDQKRQGLVLGEAAGVLLLAAEALPKYGWIRGWGCTCDADSPVAPSADTAAAQQAIQTCLALAGLAPASCDAIHTHGTGTPHNDRREMQLIQQLFPESVVLLATKGATGHTLGAAGLVNVIFSLLALHTQMLPPCVGLTQPAFPGRFVRRAQPATFQFILNLSFGFGGQNGAVLVARAGA
ncbi:MAG: beta-ketoacyl synthase N-terminal-like domain-containing protein [Gloeomargarita sp. GMQP_bins_5]